MTDVVDVNTGNGVVVDSAIEPTEPETVSWAPIPRSSSPRSSSTRPSPTPPSSRPLPASPARTSSIPRSCPPRPARSPWMRPSSPPRQLTRPSPPSPRSRSSVRSKESSTARARPRASPNFRFAASCGRVLLCDVCPHPIWPPPLPRSGISAPPAPPAPHLAATAPAPGPGAPPPPTPRRAAVLRHPRPAHAHALQASRASSCRGERRVDNHVSRSVFGGISSARLPATTALIVMPANAQPASPHFVHIWLHPGNDVPVSRSGFI